MDTTYRKIWEIKVGMNNLLTDIDILSKAFSEVGGAGDNLRRSDRIATDTLIATDEHILRRFCEHRISDIKQALSRFVYTPPTTPKTDASNASATDAKGTTDAYTIMLYVPTDAENSLLPAITDLCHDYIVNGALADWYGKIGSGNMEQATMRANESLARIRELVYHRPMP